MEINGLDIQGVSDAIKRRQRRYLSFLLDDLERVVGKEDFVLIRKLVLDNFNDYTRSIFRIILGDNVEGLAFR